LSVCNISKKLRLDFGYIYGWRKALEQNNLEEILDDMRKPLHYYRDQGPGGNGLYIKQGSSGTR